MPTKKTTKTTTVKKAVAKKAPVSPAMEHKCACGCGEHCPCHCHRVAHLIKHIIILALVFALGMFCGKMMHCGHATKHMQKMNPVFVNGCLDMASIKCPKMQEELAKADANADGCVSIEEYKAIKKEMRQARKHMRGPKMEK